MSQENKRDTYINSNTYDVTRCDIQTRVQEQESVSTTSPTTTYQPMDIDSTLEDLTRLRLTSELDSNNTISEAGML